MLTIVKWCLVVGVGILIFAIGATAYQAGAMNLLQLALIGVLAFGGLQIASWKPSAEASSLLWTVIIVLCAISTIIVFPPLFFVWILIGLTLPGRNQRKGT